MGVLLVLALVTLRYVDEATLPGAFKSFVRHSIPAAAVLFSAAFFLSVLSPEATEPNALINLAYVGAVSLVAGLLVLAPVALSGLVLAFTPVWWLFTTYFWIAADTWDLGPLQRADKGAIRALQCGARAPRSPVTGGGVDAGAGSDGDLLSVAGADAMLQELAEAGHLEVRVRGGGMFYALWEGAREIENR